MVVRRLCMCVVLAACNSSSPAGSDGGNQPDVAEVDGEADAGPYLPPGYTLMPFLSTTPSYKFSAAQQVIDSSHQYVGVLDTDVGVIVMQLLTDVAPITCNSFVFLTLNHFYDGVAFHRVIPGFMAQTGDPNTISMARSTWGLGGPGYMFGVELPDGGPTYDAAGVVGMAREMNPDTNGSQFFITFNAYPSLNGQYTVWAEVIQGLDVLPLIAVDETDDAGNDLGPPMTPTRIQQAYIGIK